MRKNNKNSKKMKAHEMTNFLKSLSDNIDEENIKIFKKIINGSKIKEYSDPEEFFYGVLYPWDQFITGFLKSRLKANENAEFIFKNSHYINAHFRNLFEKYEGSAFCADKSRTIVKRILQFYTTGERIEFNYEGEYTFHLPKKIFKTHDEIINFYEGLRNLLYGNPLKYLDVLKTILLNRTTS